MNHEDDLFAALQSAQFPELVDDRELSRRARSTRRRIRRLHRREVWTERRRWWLALIGGMAVLIAGVGAASAGLLHREPDYQDLVWCYQYVPDDLTDPHARSGVLFIDAEQTTARNALDLCFGNPDGTMGAIPDPVSQCVLPDGNVGVIPIRRCADLGLPESDVRQPTTEASPPQ